MKRKELRKYGSERSERRKNKMNRNQIREAVIALDPKLSVDDEAFRVAEILLSGVQVGTDSKKIAKFLDIPISKVSKCEDNLRENKIWVGNKTHCDWFNKDSGGISFWMDVSCAMGLVKRSK